MNSRSTAQNVSYLLDENGITKTGGFYGVIRGLFKIKNTIICGKSPKGGGGQGQNQKSLHFKCRLF